MVVTLILEGSKEELHWDNVDIYVFVWMNAIMEECDGWVEE